MPYNFITTSILSLCGCKDDFSMGECFENGKYVDQDNEAAIICYEKAAQSGNVAAYPKLGRLYFQKNHIAQSLFNYWMGAMRGNQPSKAALEQSATHGDSIANYYMGRVYEHEQNWIKAQEHYQHAITEGKDPSAMYRMGVLHQQNRLSPLTNAPIITANKSKELLWYKKAAILGSKHALDVLLEASNSEAEAALHLAEMYFVEKGGIVKKLIKAMQYFNQASQLGCAEADFQMGLIYESGEGEIVQDISKASEHYLRAAKKNHEKALQNLELLAEKKQNNGLSYEVGVIYAKRKNKINALTWFKKAADRGHEDSSAALKKMAEEDCQFACMVAKVYEKASIKQACFYYGIAMVNNHNTSRQYLFFLAEKGEKEAQYAIAYHYYHHKKDFSNAAYWCMKAADANHQQAQNYLKNTLFSAELCFKIAEKYESGDGVLKNMLKAIEFYQRANQAEDKNAAFRLGQLYETGEQNIKKDIRKAFDSYLLAAKRNHEKALDSLEALLQKFPEHQMTYELGIFYEQFIKNIDLALHWYKKSADKNNQEATRQLQQLAHENANLAYAIGCRYEKDTSCFDFLAKAMSYYCIAIIKKHPEAVDRIRHLAEKGNAEAQYILGAKHYVIENNLQQATYWCMQAAENKHVQALYYLKHTSFGSEIYVTIAESYEQGKQVKKNMALAVEFYIKATDAGNKLAPFHLGQLYEAGKESLLPDVKKAYHYYSIAFKKGHDPALKSLESLVKIQKNPQWQYELGLLHEKILENKLSAIPWYKKAADAGQEEAAHRLEQLSNNDADFAYAVAQAYDQEEERAYAYYAKAALKGHKGAFQHLENSASAGNKAAQYALGYHYCLSMGDMEKTIDWCLLAADQNYEPAKKYFTQTKFNASQCLLIARKLEEGNGLKQVIASQLYALQFYETAFSLNNIEAALYLGYFYQNDHEETGIRQDNDKACGYLIRAALQGSPDALTSIECLGNDVSPSMQYQIAQMYGCHPVQDVFKKAAWTRIAEQSTKDKQNESFFTTSSNFFSGVTHNHSSNPDNTGSLNFTNTSRRNS